VIIGRGSLMLFMYNTCSATTDYYQCLCCRY